jgi:hypothetical protein
VACSGWQRGRKTHHLEAPLHRRLQDAPHPLQPRVQQQHLGRRRLPPGPGRLARQGQRVGRLPLQSLRLQVLRHALPALLRRRAWQADGRQAGQRRGRHLLGVWQQALRADARLDVGRQLQRAGAQVGAKGVRQRRGARRERRRYARDVHHPLSGALLLLLHLLRLLRLLLSLLGLLLLLGLCGLRLRLLRRLALAALLLLRGCALRGVRQQALPGTGAVDERVHALVDAHQPDPVRGLADLQHVFEAALALGPAAQGPHLRRAAGHTAGFSTHKTRGISGVSGASGAASGAASLQGTLRAH